MTISEAACAVALIEVEACDHERAHVREDTLAWEFIEWVAATGTDQQRDVAGVVLRAHALPFDRWCAKGVE